MPRITSAGCQPASPMQSCANGISRNWPNEPPAPMMPFATERFASGIQRLTAEASCAGPAVPAPAANIRPSTRISAHGVVASGMSAAPAARSSAPPIITGRGPQRSAIAPATGCATPHMSCCTPKARLMVA